MAEGYAAADEQVSDVRRDPPDMSNDQGRAEYVKSWCEAIEKAKEYWGSTFKRMRDSAAFTSGRKQWEAQTENDDRYRANITLRHINQRVASIYAKNPRVIARRRPKMFYQVWDGSQEMLMAAVASQNPAQAMAAGMPVLDPQTAQAVLKDHQDGLAKKVLYNRMGRTLEIVAQYSLDEPIPKFKTQCKAAVRRTLTTGASYCKLGYQRVLNNGPAIEGRIKDATDRLAHLDNLRKDLADGVVDEDSKEAAELRLNLEALRKQSQIVLREGLVFSWPKAWSIIIDPNVCQLKGFLGAEWVAEEFLYTPRQVQRLFNVDVRKDYKAHQPTGERGDKRKNSDKLCAVYQIYDLVGQVMFTICLGYPDLLEVPREPDVFLEQFHPLYVLTFNDVEDDESVVPPSDAELVRPMQQDYNRAREGLRVHRQANRPAYMGPRGLFDEESKDKLASHADHEFIEHNLPKDTKVADVLQPKPTIDIDPALYDTEQAWVDIQRVGGRQAASIGGTAGVTATEVGVAERSRSEGDESNIDDLDDFLTDLMRGAGQILLLNMGEGQVRKIAGDGAVWPNLDRQAVVEELCLEIKAGSSGRPNRQGRMLAIEKVGPMLMQIPDMDPKKMAELFLTEIDEGYEIDDFRKEGTPSIVAMNSAKQHIEGGGGYGAPEAAAQGPAGSQNAPTPAGSPATAQNINPLPGDGTGAPGAGAPVPI